MLTLLNDVLAVQVYFTVVLRHFCSNSVCYTGIQQGVQDGSTHPNSYRVPQGQCNDDEVNQSQDGAIAFVFDWRVVWTKPNVRNL